MLELHELEVFLIAAETENFSEAGRILQISQPAVSGHIQNLEQRLNVRLFERTGRNIKLNEVGQAFVPVVRNLLKEARRAEEFVASRQGAVVGQLTIGCSTASGKYVLPRLMARFMEQHPDVRLTCHIRPRGDALDQLCNGEIDLAISSLRLPRRPVEYRHFSDDYLVLIVPLDHPWARLDSPLMPEDLVAYPLVLREASSGTTITLNRELAKHEMSVEMLQTHLILGNTESIVQAVIEGIGPAFVSRVSAQVALRDKRVAEAPVAHLELVQRLYMARSTAFHESEVQTRFWEFTFAPENEALRQLLT
ncbi:MAG: LysR family transcriptional regulator [Anaerolineae bacterium]|nr:LysR family transcriptional regulator [Anaerolineae bacterium]